MCIHHYNVNTISIYSLESLSLSNTALENILNITVQSHLLLSLCKKQLNCIHYKIHVLTKS